MKPTRATYTMKGWQGRDFEMRVKEGTAQSVTIYHQAEGTMLLTGPEAEQLMNSLMHYFNREVNG